MDSKTAPRNATDDRSSKEGDFEFYLKSDMPSSQIIAVLKAQRKDQKEIDAFMAKYETAKKRVNKLVRKFVEKIEQQYGHLDVPELIKKGVKFAAKHNFTGAEKESFIRHVLKGENDSPYNPFQDLNHTEMSKFLGFSTYNSGQMLEVKATDQRVLDEIVRKYNETRFLHTSIKNQVVNYRDCAPEALTGKYDRTKHNVSMHIHPVLFALFVPKVTALEERMLYANIGRMVAQRAQPYIRNTSLVDSYLPRELESDFELALDIARDPNSLAYFSDEQPIANLLKRFLIQIKLWHNVLNLRQGRYYSVNDYDVDDGVTGLLKILNSYDWTFFDSPDLYQVQDEGTILRKLLAVFSLRPSFTQISPISPMSPFANKSGLGHSNLTNIARTTFVNTPVINVKLPTVSGGVAAPVSLRAALSQSDWYVENKMLVPKHKSVIYSRDVAFFYTNRKYQAVNFANLDMAFRFVTLPTTHSNVTSINETELHFQDVLPIGNERFELRSVVVVQKPQVTGHVSTGCCAFVVQKKQHLAAKSYYYYNPQGASFMEVDTETGNYAEPSPVSVAYEHEVSTPTPGSGETTYVGFYETARKFGTIYMYVRAE